MGLEEERVPHIYIVLAEQLIESLNYACNVALDSILGLQAVSFCYGKLQVAVT